MVYFPSFYFQSICILICKMSLVNSISFVYINVINNIVALLLFSICLLCPLFLCSSYPALLGINQVSHYYYAILLIPFSNVFSGYSRAVFLIQG